MTFDKFLRKWGKAAGLVYTADGTLKVAQRGDDALLRLMAEELEAIPVDKRHLEARSVHLTTRMVLNDSNARNWNVDENDILSSTTLDGKHMEKFSWNPKTGEFLFIWPSQNHATAKGNAPFDDYVRGIVLWKQKTVTFRPFWPTWMRRTAYDEFDEDAAIVSFDAQYNAQDMLKKHSAPGWNFRVNITNRQLEEVTGRGRW